MDAIDPEIWLDYSEIYYDNEDYPKAIEIIEKGISLQEENIDLHYRLVAYLLQSGKVKEACEKLEFAMEMDYEKHTQLLEFYHPTIDNLLIMDLINNHKK